MVPEHALELRSYRDDGIGAVLVFILVVHPELSSRRFRRPRRRMVFVSGTCSHETKVVTR